MAADLELFAGLCTTVGCSAVLLELACGAVEGQWPPQGVLQVCNNYPVFTPTDNPTRIVEIMINYVCITLA